MKRLLLLLYIVFSSIFYACKFVITNYYETNFSQEIVMKDVEFFDDYKEGTDLYDTNAIFKKGNIIYIRGKEYITVNNNTFKYLGNGYYQNENKLYFLDKELEKYDKSNKINTYHKTKTKVRNDGTSCSGKYRTNTYYLELDNKIYKNGSIDNSFSVSRIFKSISMFVKSIFS